MTWGWIAFWFTYAMGVAVYWEESVAHMRKTKGRGPTPNYPFYSAEADVWWQQHPELYRVIDVTAVVVTAALWPIVTGHTLSWRTWKDWRWIKRLRV